MHIMLGDYIIVRVKQLIGSIVMAAGIIMVHMNLIHVNQDTKDLIELVCFLIVGMSKAPVSMVKERKDE